MWHYLDADSSRYGMELVWVFATLAVGVLEMRVFRRLPGFWARWAFIRVRPQSLAGPAGGAGSLVWPPALVGPAAEYCPPGSDHPAFVRTTQSGDLGVLRLSPSVEPGRAELSLRVMPATPLAPYLFAALPLFVSAVWGPVWPGVLYSAGLGLAWALFTRFVLAPRMRRLADPLLCEVAARMGAGASPSRADAAAGRRPKRARKKGRRG